MSIASAISALQSASSDIATAIAKKGVIVPSGSGFNDYASLIAQIGKDLSYVQNGLVLHLDGINQGGTSGLWTSLVGNTYYTLNTHSTSESNAIVMDGSGLITATNPITNVTYSTGTIEICADYLGTGSGAIYYGRADSMAVVVGGSGYAFGNASSNNFWTITKQSKMLLSMNSARCVLNGTSGGTLGSNSWSAGTAYTIGGRSVGGNMYYANVRIYAIRIYNRQLSENEMIANQRIDNIRFNLGLTL